MQHYPKFKLDKNIYQLAYSKYNANDGRFTAAVGS